MALKALQFTLAANTSQNLLTGFANVQGSASSPLQVLIKNEDLSNTVFIGSPDVSGTKGVSLLPGQSLPMGLTGGPSTDVPWAISIGTPIVSVLVAGQ